MTLQQIKEETAKKWGFPGWDDYVTTRPIYDHVCELYAESKVKEKDERIADLVRTLHSIREECFRHRHGEDYGDSIAYITMKVDNILNPKPTQP